MATIPQFEAALRQLQAALADLDGDGQPDAAIEPETGALRSIGGNAMAVNAIRSGLSSRTAAMAAAQRPGIMDELAASQPPDQLARAGVMPGGGVRSYQPTRGEDAAAALRAQGPIGNAMAAPAQAFLDYGSIPAEIATEIARQPIRAGEAVGEAAFDPTLANVTNAGVQTALAFGRPVAAGVALVGGLAEGMRRDFGIGVSSPAAAAPKKKTASGYTPTNLPHLTDEQNAAYNEARRRIQAGEFSGGAERRTLEAEVKRLSDLSARLAEAEVGTKRELEAEKKRKEQEEYDRAVKRAEAFRDEELEGRHTFKDTNLGEIYKTTGGAAPFILAGGLGGLARAGLGNNAMGKYIVPAIEGATTGMVGTSLPLIYNAYTGTPVENPEKTAYMAYARELPPEHPRKQEFARYAEGLPDENPVRQPAAEALRDPWRLAVSALEGAGAGISGATIANAFARFGRGTMNAMARGRSTSAEPEARIIVRDAAGRYRTPDGRFTSPPKDSP